MASCFVVLHGSGGLELSLLGYLYRVLLHLAVIGGLALLVHWGTQTIADRSAAETDRRDD